MGKKAVDPSRLAAFLDQEYHRANFGSRPSSMQGPRSRGGVGLRSVGGARSGGSWAQGSWQRLTPGTGGSFAGGFAEPGEFGGAPQPGRFARQSSSAGGKPMSRASRNRSRMNMSKSKTAEDSGNPFGKSTRVMKMDGSSVGGIFGTFSSSSASVQSLSAVDLGSAAGAGLVGGGGGARPSTTAAAPGNRRGRRAPLPSTFQERDAKNVLDADQSALILNDSKLGNYGVVLAPQFQKLQARPRTVGYLATPEMRRRELSFQMANRRAAKLIRKAKGDTDRRKNIMRKVFPNGAIGVDSPANIDSVVYAKTAKNLHTRYARHNEHAAKRRNRLQHIQGESSADHATGRSSVRAPLWSVPFPALLPPQLTDQTFHPPPPPAHTVFKERKGYDILDHCNEPSGAPRSQWPPMFQTLGKGTGKQDQTLAKTMEVIFPDSAMERQGKTSVEDRAEQFRKVYRTSKGRMQRLRNEDTGGKKYNIITNAKAIPEPTSKEKMNKWMLHPSFQAIPKVRFR